MKFVILAVYFILQTSYLKAEADDSYESSNTWPCKLPRGKAVELFKQKTLLNPYPLFPNDPYTNQTVESYAQINATLTNTNIVCAIKYDDNNQEVRQLYETKEFADKQSALSEDFIVTHQGRCGACSSLNDLAIFLSVDLTAPARKCGLIGTFSQANAKKCLINIGFTESCAEIWLYNTINTRKECFGVCMLSWVSGEPNTKPDGTLNDCLQCDEDKSGPVFKYFSGRSRRNSGIKSEIDRPSDSIYNVTHCYY